MCVRKVKRKMSGNNEKKSKKLYKKRTEIKKFVESLPASSTRTLRPRSAPFSFTNAKHLERRPKISAMDASKQKTRRKTVSPKIISRGNDKIQSFEEMQPNLFSNPWPFNHCKLVLSFGNHSKTDLHHSDSDKQKSGWSKEEETFVYHEHVTSQEMETLENEIFTDCSSDESSEEEQVDSDFEDIFIPTKSRMKRSVLQEMKLLEIRNKSKCNAIPIEELKMETDSLFDLNKNVQNEKEDANRSANESPSRELEPSFNGSKFRKSECLRRMAFNNCLKILDDANTANKFPKTDNNQSSPNANAILELAPEMMEELITEEELCNLLPVIDFENAICLETDNASAREPLTLNTPDVAHDKITSVLKRKEAAKVKEVILKLRRCDYLLKPSQKDFLLLPSPSDSQKKKFFNAITKKPFVCLNCDKCFAHKQTLTRHLSVHILEKPYQCETCLQYFSQKGNLLDHKKRVHLKEKHHECSICFKRFYRKRDLVNHIRIHTGENPHQCKTCGKRFSNISNLRNHSIRHDENLKRFSCSTCSKAFYTRADLQKHERVHSGEKPLKCSKCLKSFALSCTLGRHSRSRCCEKRN